MKRKERKFGSEYFGPIAHRGLHNASLTENGIKAFENAIKNAGLDPAKHMIAVTSATSPLANNPMYLDAFYMDDYIGGRYSSSSMVGGAILSLAFGAKVFDDFLKGAAEEDKLATNEDLLKNQLGELCQRRLVGREDLQGLGSVTAERKRLR